MYLYVDGSSERMALAYSRMPEEKRNSTIWAKTAREAIDVLKSDKASLKEVSLEHDLNPNVRGDVRREDSGMEIVRFLEKQDASEYSNCVFVVHTWDDRCGRKMTKRLSEAGFAVKYSPFGT